MITFSSIQARYQILKGDTSTLVADSTGKSHINWSVLDIVNRHPFNWNLKSTSLTLTAGVANLPADFNATWIPKDARIVVANQDTDNVFTHIDISERDQYSATDYVYWVTYDSDNDVYVFNSTTQTGTVVVYYYFIPTDMSADGDYCIVPDGEAVAYLSASKNWVGDERNIELKREYEVEANNRIETMWANAPQKEYIKTSFKKDIKEK